MVLFFKNVFYDGQVFNKKNFRGQDNLFLVEWQRFMFINVFVKIIEKF